MKNSAAAGPKDRASGKKTLTLSRANYRAEKNEKLNYDFNFSTSVFPSRAGDGETVIPADSIAAAFEPASPLPPEMIAPACPMRRPVGAVKPAMKPTIGFLRTSLTSFLRDTQAYS